MSLASRLSAITAKQEKTIIGIMSGMSMDGINLACITVSGEYPKLKVNLIGTHMCAFSPDLRENLLKSRTASVAEVANLNFRVATEFAQAVEAYLARSGTPRGKIDLIGSHGQTLYHSSQSEKDHVTIQVGDPSIIAERTGIPTIGNFRIRDMAVGGQGAPLVALADYILYHQSGNVTAVNNLGSISNVTVIPAVIEDVLAFDTGPANMVIDYFASRIPGNTRESHTKTS